MLKIYTDGACAQNGTWTGGWGMAVIQDDQCIYKQSGGDYNTTGNRMELKAVVAALEYITMNNIKAATIYCDSAYIVNAIKQKWLANWVKNGWKTSKKQDVANQDLWGEILKHKIPKIEKVRGHSNVVWNEFVDKLAVSSRTQLDKGGQNEDINTDRWNVRH